MNVLHGRPVDTPERPVGTPVVFSDPVVFLKQNGDSAISYFRVANIQHEHPVSTN